MHSSGQRAKPGQRGCRGRSPWRRDVLCKTEVGRRIEAGRWADPQAGLIAGDGRVIGLSGCCDRMPCQQGRDGEEQRRCKQRCVTHVVAITLELTQSPNGALDGALQQLVCGNNGSFNQASPDVPTAM